MLKRVHIQNFKSLKDVTLDLQKVNLLIGPNNSGKTNFLKALEYFGSESQTVAHESNKKKLSFRYNNSPVIIRLKFDPGSRYSIVDTYEYYVIGLEVSSNGNVLREDWYQSVENPEVKITDAQEPSFNYNKLIQKVGKLLVYAPQPNNFLQMGTVGTGEEEVTPNTSNLVGYLDKMLSKYRKTVFDRIERDLQACIPEFDEIKLDDVLLAKELKEL